ncbi:MAG: DUF5996 family protein [Chloroflexales bacterium]|nr:DUF5996 family protein [Chloroflexales bacterium]
MLLSSLKDWRETAASLHRATQVVAAIRVAVTDPLPNFLHLSTTIRHDGLSTGPLSFGEVYLDFGAARIVHTPTQGQPIHFGLEGSNQASLTKALLDHLAAQGHAIEAAKNESGHEAALNDTTPFAVDPRIGADYATALYRIFTATARFRARLFAPMTPIVVWPEHFDLSFLVFGAEKATEESPHLNFGFAPYSDGIDRPYLYAYVWPLPASGYSGVSLPPLVNLDTPGYGGPLVWYDDFAAMEDPEAFVEATFLGIYRALAPLLTE